MLIRELDSYRIQEKDTAIIEENFMKIKQYIKANYIDKCTALKNYEFEIHYNPYTHSYLVIDFKEKDVYLSHRSHGSSRDDVFRESLKDGGHSVWKYEMCFLVIKHWEQIKKNLNENLIRNDVAKVCNNFKL